MRPAHGRVSGRDWELLGSTATKRPPAGGAGGRAGGLPGAYARDAAWAGAGRGGDGVAGGRGAGNPTAAPPARPGRAIRPRGAAGQIRPGGAGAQASGMIFLSRAGAREAGSGRLANVGGVVILREARWGLGCGLVWCWAYARDGALCGCPGVGGFVVWCGGWRPAGGAACWWWSWRPAGSGWVWCWPGTSNAPHRGGCDSGPVEGVTRGRRGTLWEAGAALPAWHF